MRLGKTVGQLLRETSSMELTEWIAYLPLHDYEEESGKDAQDLYGWDGE